MLMYVRRRVPHELRPSDERGHTNPRIMPRHSRAAGRLGDCTVSFARSAGATLLNFVLAIGYTFEVPARGS